MAATLFAAAAAAYTAPYALPALTHRPSVAPIMRVTHEPPRRPAMAAAAASLLLTAKPAIAAAKAVPFTLLGKNSAALFPIQNAALLSWVLYLFLPRWRPTKAIALAAPCLHSVLYFFVLLHSVRNPTPGVTVDFSSLKGIMGGLATPDGAFAAWLHYCVFDPLVGLGIVLDAKQQRVPHLLCVVPLLLTMLAGPVGFLSYLLVRTATLGLRKLKRSRFSQTGGGMDYTQWKPATPEKIDPSEWKKKGFKGF